MAREKVDPDFINSALNGVSRFALAFSVAASALTIALKLPDGTSNPSSTDLLGFRLPSTSVIGLENIRTVSGALSLTIPSTATMGRTNGLNGHLYHYLIDNAGTLELAVSGKWFGRSGTISTTVMNTSSDAYDTMYSAVARSNVAFICIGRSVDTQTTAGTWAATPTSCDLMPIRPYNVSFKAVKSADQTGVTSGVFTKVSFQTELFDLGGFFDNVTNYRFQPPAGLYHFTFGLGMQPLNDSSYAIAYIYKNGTHIGGTYTHTGLATADEAPNASLVDMANGTDYYEVFGYGNGAGTITFQSSLVTFFSAQQREAIL